MEILEILGILVIAVIASGMLLLAKFIVGILFLEPFSTLDKGAEMAGEAHDEEENAQ